MKGLTRFGVSIETDLLRRFDRLIRKGGIANRSEAFRDLIRSRIVEAEATEPGTHALSVLSLAYDHHRRDLEEHLTEIQHHHFHDIISTPHVHIDHDRCLEVILIRGTIAQIRDIARRLSSSSGIQHRNLVIASTDHG